MEYFSEKRVNIVDRVWLGVLWTDRCPEPEDLDRLARASSRHIC